MALTVYAAPAVEPITATEAKSHMRVDLGDDDTLISSLITAARQYCETHLRRTLCTTTWRLTLDRFPSWEIELPVPPIQSVTSITYVDADGATQTLSSSLYRVDTASEPGRITPAYDRDWPDTREITNAVVVTFVAGYGGASSVPQSIKQALLMLVAHWYEHREAQAEQQLADVPLGVSSLLWSERLLSAV